MGFTGRDADLLAAAVAAGRVTVVSDVRAKPPGGGYVQTAPPSGLTEAEFTAAVIAAAQAAGWLVAHFAPARVLRRGVEKYETPVRGDGRGFPDLCLARGGRVVLAELKSETGVLSEHQARWIRESGANVWRPKQWELILATIRGEA